MIITIYQILKVAMVLASSAPELYKVFMKIVEIFKDAPVAEVALKVLPMRVDDQTCTEIHQEITAYDRGAEAYLAQFGLNP